MTRRGTFGSIDYYKQAIDVDPAFALSYAGIADSYLMLGLNNGPPRDYMEKGKDWALSAIRLDKELVEPHVSLAIYYLFYTWDWDAARSELDKALAQKRDFAEAHHYKGHYYEATGRLDLAEPELRRAVELDPGSPINRCELGWTLLLRRRYPEALKELRRTSNADPTFLLARESLAILFALLGDHTQALVEAHAHQERAWMARCRRHTGLRPGHGPPNRERPGGVGQAGAAPQGLVRDALPSGGRRRRIGRQRSSGSLAGSRRRAA